MGHARAEIDRIGGAVRDRFEAQKRVLSFEQYLDLLVEHPERHMRDAAFYLRDCFQYYGSYDVERPWGSVTRFRLFDLPFAAQGQRGQQQRDHLIGQESIQMDFYGALSNFVREGRPNRLLLLHGPNGSSKTTFTHAIMRALEHYSATDEGALYRFGWVFPRGRDGKTIGFGSSDDLQPAGASFAHLPDAQIDVKLPSELREHPLLLLPIDERRAFLERTVLTGEDPSSLPDWIWNGELSHKNRQIYEALLTACRGDLGRVLNHVQVERYYISRRYRVGAVTIGPEMAVDASERQITADRTIGALPASLAALALYEPYGELVDASGGMIDYSDLLKRPLDAWKYLLLSIEDGEVSLPLSNLHINAVLVASSNEVHLAAFKEHHEYNSFRGRLHMIRVPYLLDHRSEQAIYDSQIVPQVSRHVAPHVTWVAALWAVLTRLKRAQAERYASSSLGRVAADLTPLEKADLYARGAIPGRLSPEDARELRAGIEAVYRESESLADYEGRVGASPREVRTLLLDAAADPTADCVSPPGVLDAIDAFCQRNDYQFLKQTPDRGYHDHRAFIRQIHDRWLDMVDQELRSCTGLIEDERHRGLFDQYMTHVSFWAKSERLYNDVTGEQEDPDEILMKGVEEKLDIGTKPDDFRRNLISTVAARAIDHPGEEMDYGDIFPRYIEGLRAAYFSEHSKQVGAIARDMLTLMDEGPGLDEERHAAARKALDRFLSEFGYEMSSARCAVGELVMERYSA